MATKAKKQRSSAEIAEMLEKLKNERVELEGQLKEAKKREQREAAERAAEDARIAGKALARAAFGADGNEEVAKLAALMEDGTLELLLAEALGGCDAWNEAVAAGEEPDAEDDAVDSNDVQAEAGDGEGVAAAEMAEAAPAQVPGWGM